MGKLRIIVTKYFASIPTKTWIFGSDDSTHETKVFSTYFGLHDICFNLSTALRRDEKYSLQNL